MDPLYLTTAIPFVNAAPHLGHALELVQTDAIARHARLRGPPGPVPDRHRRERAEERAGRGRRPASTSPTFVTRNATLFADLAGRVAGLLRRLHPHQRRSPPRPGGRGDLACVPRRRATSTERRTRAGTARAASSSSTVRATSTTRRPSGSRRRTGTSASRATRTRDARARSASGGSASCPTSGRTRCSPSSTTDVRDISVSRSRARARNWGIRVPDDPDQIVYVWFDALDQLPERGAGRRGGATRSCGGT